MSYKYRAHLQNQFFPIIPFTIFTEKSNKFDTVALIDSGATISIFKTEVAQQIGIEIKTGKEIELDGVGGKIKGYVHNLKIEVSGKNLTIPVVFSNDYLVSFNLLGRSSFFENFKIIFDEKNKIVELK